MENLNLKTSKLNTDKIQYPKEKQSKRKEYSLSYEKSKKENKIKNVKKKLKTIQKRN